MKIFTFFSFLFLSITGYAQLSLPINFDSTNITYILTDFGGNASSVVVDPTNANNMVAQSIKTGAAELWAGTTMGANELAEALPFTSMDTKMSVKVWSPDAGIPVRLKVEDATDPTKSVETEANTTMAGAWETLEFDFSNEAPGTAALNLTYTYNKASIFFNFGTDGMTAGEKTYYWDDVDFIGGGGGGPAQIDLPVTFEDANTDYTLTDFGGNASSVVVDPTNANNMVAQSIKTGAAELWAGTTVGTDAGFANAIPFTAIETKMTVRVWSPDAGIPVRLKVEDHTDPTKSVETETLTTTAMAWETLEFDFSNEVMGTAALNLSFTYDKASIFFNFGTDGMTAGEKTYYWDDVEFVSSNLNQIDLPVTFEDANTDYTLTDFGGNASSVVVDPTNANNMVAQSIKTGAAELWAGTTVGTDAGFANAIPFTAIETKMTVRVWSPDTGIPVRLKAEDHTDPTKSVETETLTTTAMAWETLEFDFSNEVMGTAALNLSFTYDKASIFFNFGTDGATAGEKTYYWDDVEFVSSNLDQIDLPVTFEDANTDYTLTDFGGNASSVVVDPTNANNMVAQSIKTGAAELWAGTTVGTDAGFANAIPFTAIETKMTVRVWSPDAGIPVRLKAEDHTDPTKSVETETLTTTAMAWETLEFDFSNEVMGTAALNLSFTYDKASIFFNFGTDGATAGEKTYYWDDVEFVSSNLDQIDLPVTFEDANTDYTLTDFGGNASSVVVDPTNANNMVAQSIKTGAAELWAGTTVGTAAGFANAIPFTASETKMKVRVWSPDAGIPIRLKVEDATDPTKSVETETNTTVAMEWELLEFDFSNEVSGTAPINLTYTYDKASIFFNFGTDGATAGEKTYYWDDVQFGGIFTVVDIIVNSPDHDTLEAAVIAAELADDLSGPGPFTVFAPTDDAFAALPAGVLDALLLDPTGDLAQILLYHVLGANVLSTDLTDGQMAETLQGEDIEVTINGSDVFINQAQVTTADLLADNGVVHVIDAVLLPPSFVGVKTLNAADYNIKVAPNPASSYFYIEFPEALNEEVLITLFDVSGRLLKQERIQQQWSEINTSDLNAGTYFLKIDTKDASYYQKVMIAK